MMEAGHASALQPGIPLLQQLKKSCLVWKRLQTSSSLHGHGAPCTSPGSGHANRKQSRGLPLAEETQRASF